MKKNLLFMTIAAAAMIFASCSNDDNVENPAGKPGTLAIKISGAAQSRAIEEPGVNAEGTIKLNNGYIFILNPSGAVIDGAALVPTEAQGASGQIFPRDVASDSQVYIVGNVPADVTPGDLKSLTAIQVELSAISAQTKYDEAALANSNGKPAAIDVPNNVTFDEDHTTVEATVSIELNPLFSRLELGKVTGNSLVAGFKVAGVYVDDMYPSFTLGGSYGGTIYSQGIKTDFTGATGDDDICPATGDGGTPEVFSAIPGVNKIWAYQVPSGNLPRLIIHLTDVVFYQDADNDKVADVDANNNKILVPQTSDLYLTVTGYNGISSFERGKIYNIGGNTTGTGAGITFGPDQTGTTPNPQNVTLQVNVTIKEWVIEYPDAKL